MSDLLLFLAGLFSFLAPGTIAFRRARRELANDVRVSATTFVFALFAYTALAVAVILASWRGSWPLPLDLAFSRIAGTTLFFIGAVLHLSARLQFRSFRMAWGLESKKLITSGIYGWVRHPQNLGWALLLAGAGLAGRSGAALALTLLYVVTCLIWLPVEERALQRQFGETYRRYQAATSGLLPFGRRQRSPRLTGE